MIKTGSGISMSFGAVGGLLALPAIPGYYPFVIVSIFLFFIAYKSYALEKCKNAFVIISAFNFLIGNALYFAPHADDDGLQGYGLLFMAVVATVSMIALAYIINLERDSEDT